MSDSFTIDVRISSVSENAKAVADTLLLAFNNKNNMLPYLDRVAKMFPEIRSLLSSEMEREEILPVVTKLIRDKKRTDHRHIEEQAEHFRELAQGVLSEGVSEMLDMFRLSYSAPVRFTCRLGLYNPFPRSVQKRDYCLHYDISDKVFLRASLHEINHMVLFNKWRSMQDIELETEPEFPDILWYLEELAVAPTLNDPRIQRIVPVQHSPYQSMGEIFVDGVSLPECIERIYERKSDMAEFLLEAYAFLEQNKEVLVSA